MLQAISARIFVDSEILENEFKYAFGSKKNDLVTFVFHNVKTGKETERTCFNYGEALELAVEKCKDNRCKNFEYYIY